MPYSKARRRAKRKARRLELARTEEVVLAVDSPHGTKYIVDGRIETPTGVDVILRTVWIVDAGRRVPRFVTAYPA